MGECELSTGDVKSLKDMARRMRMKMLKMALDAGPNGAHLGGAMSCVEILAVLYGAVMKIDPARPDAPDRDRFIPSKAHCVLAYYSALAEAGLITEDDAATFEKNGTSFAGHPARSLKKGIEFTGGSLGQAMPYAIGVSLALRASGRTSRTFVLLGDGECDEGSNWEAFMAASHFGLDNITIIIDKNDLQYDGPTDEIMKIGELDKKLASFGWIVRSVDGHDAAELLDALRSPSAKGPSAIIAQTVKGKGVSFMENVREWHHSRLTQTQYDAAVAEVERSA